eukprot:1047118-Rhodomonas_salina.1
MSRQQQGIVPLFNAEVMRFVEELERQPDGADPMLIESRLGRRVAPALHGMSRVFTTILDGGTVGLAPHGTNAGRVVSAVNKFGGSNVAPVAAAGAATIAAGGTVPGAAYALAVQPAGAFASALTLGGLVNQIRYTVNSRTRNRNWVNPSNTEEPLSAPVSPRPRRPSSTQPTSNNTNGSGRRLQNVHPAVHENNAIVCPVSPQHTQSGRRGGGHTGAGSTRRQRNEHDPNNFTSPENNANPVLTAQHAHTAHSGRHRPGVHNNFVNV